MDERFKSDEDFEILFHKLGRTIRATLAGAERVYLEQAYDAIDSLIKNRRKIKEKEKENAH